MLLEAANLLQKCHRWEELLPVVSSLGGATPAMSSSSEQLLVDGSSAARTVVTHLSIAGRWKVRAGGRWYH